MLLVPLLGHTLGRCGVVVHQGDRWLLHVGDAYDLEVELTTADHPVSALAAHRTDDNDRRRRESSRRQRDHDGNGRPDPPGNRLNGARGRAVELTEQ